MESITLNAPAMYADHHVQEVRRILFELPGVKDVYASSAFKAVEVNFDPDQVGQEEIVGKLEETGYMDEISLPVEANAAVYLAEDQPAYFRHTAVHQSTKDVSFAQNVAYSGRPLWNCPGIGVIKTEMEE